jgi:hypothetical protein
VHAAGIVSDHAAQRASVMSGGIRAERQMVFFRGVTKAIKNHTGLNPRNPSSWIDLDNVVHVAREIEHQSYVAALSGERGSATTTEERRAELTGYRHGGNDIVEIAGKDYSDGNLAIIGPIGRIESTASLVETYVTAHVPAQSGGKAAGIHSGGFGCAIELGEVTLHVGGEG